MDEIQRIVVANHASFTFNCEVRPEASIRGALGGNWGYPQGDDIGNLGKDG